LLHLRMFKLHQSNPYQTEDCGRVVITVALYAESPKIKSQSWGSLSLIKCSVVYLRPFWQMSQDNTKNYAATLTCLSCKVHDSLIIQISDTIYYKVYTELLKKPQINKCLLQEA
jgi:hypothetical protein